MKKTKVMVMGFAVFAALLMLMTTCMARPVQEKTNIEAVEDLEQELMSSLEALNTKLARDCEVNSLISELIRDREVTSVVRSIEVAGSQEEILSGVEQLAAVLQDKSGFGQLTTLVEKEYSAELGAISEEISSVGYNTCFIITILILRLVLAVISTIILMLYWFIKWLFGNDDSDDVTA